MVAVRGLVEIVIMAAWQGIASAESVRDRQEKACQGDVYKLCKDEVPDEDKIAACMGKHRSELSMNCGIMYDRGMK